MQFEDFDKKIKEAAEHHHPAYDEKAWDKMEKLLDKHMPGQKDVRRRIFFFLLSFLAIALIGGGIYLKTNQTRNSDSSLKDNSKNETATKATEQKPVASAKSAEDVSTDKISVPVTDKPASANTAKETEQKNNLEIRKPGNTISASQSKTNNRVYKPIVIKEQLALIRNSKKTPTTGNKPANKAAIDKGVVIENNVHGEKEKNIAEAPPGKETSVSGKTSDNSSPGITQPIKNTSANNIVSNKDTKQDSVSQKKIAGITKLEEGKKDTTLLAQQKPSPKPGKQKKSAFAITFTTMPDLSTVGTTKAGKVKLGYGAGLSYTLNRFTVRSGFYAGRKVYTAGPEDYHPKKPNWIDYVNLDKVDANCKVYEIPFLVSYNFAQAKKSNWFFSTGLSTYIMKSEKYDYYYTDPNTGNPGWKTVTINNQYKHFFSILNLSAGYERRLNNMLSIGAEPYIKVPLDGIGYGKIQLNSAGIALTLSIKPFVSKK